MESPTYEGSFELDESLAGSVERSTSKARLATRTPQHLAQRLAASSVDSVASDLEVSKRSVTFSRRKATSAPRRPFANDATPNPTDDEAEYSEDFDADADALQSSASYAEDFEPSAAKSYGDDFENESTGPAPAPARPAAFRARALPSAASSMAYSSDFEKGSVASARVKSRAAAGARAAAAAVPPPPPSLDALLHALASSARLPQQVADLRSQISKLAPESHAARGPLEAPPSATLDDTGIPTAFAAAGGSTHARGRASSYNTHRRKKTGASGRSRVLSGATLTLPLRRL
ncbi:hypothetical protein M885DRAFT_96572 [Pelagophyceae sp. CCMP2097]|nr:hypothetical protein M885DRAFT_96572 [Pelagophyceae sp. CCMP2097]